MKSAVKIGPPDHGRPMTLEEFDRAEGQEGYLFELSRGVIAASDVPKPKHLAMVTAARRQLAAYDLANPGKIFTIAAGSDCKILLADFQSERHPDIAIYKTAPPAGDDVWSIWVPELAIEVVSPSSMLRDYSEKPEEYLAFGIKEYWILDEERRAMLVHRRVSASWREQTVRPPKLYKTRLFPGLEFSCAAVFAAADGIGE